MARTGARMDDLIRGGILDGTPPPPPDSVFPVSLTFNVSSHEVQDWEKAWAEQGERCLIVNCECPCHG